MTDVADDPTLEDELDLRDAVEVAKVIANLAKRVRDLETRQQLGTSTTSESGDPDAPTVADVADLAQTATFDIAGLNEALGGLDTALRQNAEDVRGAAIAAEAAGQVGQAAADLANEAADDALAKANEAKVAADDALEAAANAGGGNAYETRAPTSADQADPDTGKPFHDAALWFVRASNTGIVTGAYQYAQPDPAQPGTWAQITLNNDVIANLDAGKITAGYLSAARIEAETITGAKIATDTLTSRVIAADAITAAELAADAVLARNVKAGEIQTGHLAALLIDASKIQAGAIIAEKIGAGAVTADSIAAGAITATKLSADAINGKTITGVTINGGTINGVTITGATVQTAADGTNRIMIQQQTVNGTSYGSLRFVPSTYSATNVNDVSIRPDQLGNAVIVGYGDVGIGAVIGITPRTGAAGPGSNSDQLVNVRTARVEASANISTPQIIDYSTGVLIYNGGRLRAAATNDVSPTSTGHGLQVGPDTGVNLAMDQNEIMVRDPASLDGSGTAPLYINANGGNIGLGSDGYRVDLPGRLNATHLLYASAAGSTTTSGTIAAGGSGTRNITFPSGRFTVAPFVFGISENGRLTIAAQNITTTGATLSINNWSPAGAPAGSVVNWFAIQQSAGSASG